MLRHGNQNLTLIMSFLCLIKYFLRSIDVNRIVGITSQLFSICLKKEYSNLN